MADEDDDRAGGGEAAHDCEELRGLGRREDRRRLVEDQHRRLSRDRLDQLDLRLLADREVADAARDVA